MHILDNHKKIKSLDKSNMTGSIDVLRKQIGQAWNEVKKIKIPDNYKNVNNVVINGMGGSGLGAHIIQSVYFKKLKMPISNIHSYDLPGAVNNKTLYILSSYSGSTEEPIGTFKQAQKKDAKILGITTGKNLGKLIQDKKIPGYLFKPKYNPCNEPRMGIGYSVTGLLGLLKQCKIININDNEIKKTILLLSKIKRKYSVDNRFQNNIAKQIANSIKGKIPIIITADFLAGNAHVMANQINENAKNFSAYFIISELNHHLLEGLTNPKTNANNLQFIFFESNLYHKKNQTRMQITKDVIKKNKINHTSYNLQGKTNLEQSFEMLQLGSYISFYLAILNKINPSPIPWVNYFKEQLVVN